MHELLTPAPLDRGAAVALCSTWLRTRWPRWRLARTFLPRAERDDVTALCAWHRLARQGDCANQLERELEGVYTGSASAALGIALAPAVRRHDLSATAFRGPLQELKRTADVHAWETRDELAQHVRRLALPEGRLLVRVLGAASERNDFLADALSTGIQIAAFLEALPTDLAAGRLYLPMEDLTRFGVDLRELHEKRMSEGVRDVIASQIAWARAHLAKGWPLCEELGAWRGRLLAYVLRWHAASLSAIEARRYAILDRQPAEGWLRVLACCTASAASRGAPELVP